MSNILSNIWADLILLLGPIAGLAGGRKLRTATPPRRIIYLGNAANLIVLGIVTGAIDLSNGGKALGLVRAGNSPAVVLTWSISLGLVCVAIVSTLLIA